eukprot:1060085_1
MAAEESEAKQPEIVNPSAAPSVDDEVDGNSAARENGKKGAKIRMEIREHHQRQPMSGAYEVSSVELQQRLKQSDRPRAAHPLGRQRGGVCGLTRTVGRGAPEERG